MTCPPCVMDRFEAGGVGRARSSGNNQSSFPGHGDPAGLSEITACGKEVRESHGLVFTQGPVWACKCERGQSSSIARVKI